MTESQIKANEREAARLFERGVAAARGGQRRIAASLLSRVIQLNPRHEMGWLWLSGVLDNPDEIAFCLRSVLGINPHNERARQGLAWLESQGKIRAQPAPVAVEAAPDQAESEKDRTARHEGESWWVNWRRSRREMSRARVVFWTVPILLLALTLGLNVVLRDAVERNTVLAQIASQPTVAPTAPPAPPAIIQAELAVSDDSQALAYLSAIEASREQLRAGVQAYKDATNQPGGSSIIHAAAAVKLRELINSAHSAIEELTPPPTLAQAHNQYLTGLEFERQALNDILEFYNSFQVQFANRATLRMVDASRQIDQAHALFDKRRMQATIPLVPAQSMR